VLRSLDFHSGEVTIYALKLETALHLVSATFGSTAEKMTVLLKESSYANDLVSIASLHSAETMTVRNRQISPGECLWRKKSEDKGRFEIRWKTR
jgi:hypothetical protein